MVYGGKVLDKFDRRILLAYLDEYLGDFLFDSFQMFHFYNGKGYTNYAIPYAAKSKMDFLGKFLFLFICLFIIGFSVYGVDQVNWLEQKFTKCDSSKHMK